MLAASNRGKGMNVGFPDVCLTPPIPPKPIPYPNFALNCLAVPFSPVVFVCGFPALNLLSKIPVTFGDDAGTLHPVYKKVGIFLVGNPIVFVDLIPAINLTCPTMGNAMNNKKGSQLVPSAVNVFYTYAAKLPGSGGLVEAAPSTRPASAEDADELSSELESAPPPSAILLPDGIGLLRVSAFTTDLPARAYMAIRGLEASGMRGVVVDLRDNPGGEMRAFLDFAADFLPRGEVIGVTVDSDGDEVTYRSTRDPAYTMPVAILVSRGTASAAELFAGALKAHRRAVIVGETTFGKASAQSLVRAPDGSGLTHATAALCELPGGASLQGKGVEPDVEVASAGSPGEDLDRDPQLSAAFHAVRHLLGG